MTVVQNLTIKASAIRSRLNEIAGLADDLTPDLQAETDKLTSEYSSVEAKLRAAIVAESDEVKDAETRMNDGEADAETRELRALQSRVSLSRYLSAYGNQTALDGAEKEINEHRSLSVDGKVIAWDALLPTTTATETRADVVTPAPAAGQPVNQHAILPRVFAMTSTARLGVSMPTVGVGAASYPIVSSGQSPEFVQPGAAKEADAGTIGSNVLTPQRLQARFRFRIEDTALLMGLEDALRADLVAAMGDQLDKQLLGAGDARVRGFLATAANGGLADYNDPGSVVTYQTAAGQAARGVDGIYAGSEAACTWIVGTATYRTLAGLIQTTGDVSATERLRRLLMGFTASANIPAPASNVQSGILAKMGSGAMTAVCPVWSGLRLLRDESTAAAEGEINVTAVALHNFRILRPAAFVRTKLKLS